MAKVLLKELEPYRLTSIEEPVLSEHLDTFAGAMINTAAPVALAERLYSRWDFKSILASGAIDIIQPDPSHSGGITETRKIAAMAEAYDVERAEQGHRWRNPVWRHAIDQSLNGQRRPPALR